MSVFPFLRLPRELRDIIYSYYALEADGLYFDYDASTFRKADGRPRDLSLVYTCKTIRAEMHDIPLKTNLLVFATACSESQRLRAGRFQRLLDGLLEMRCFVLASTRLVPHMRSFLTPVIMAKVREKYPQFLRLFDVIDTWNTSRNVRDLSRYRLSSREWGGSYSTFSSFVVYVLRLLTEGSPNFIEAAASMPRAAWLSHRDFVNSRFLVSGCCSSWSIPSEQELNEMEKVIPLESRYYRPRDVFAFSRHHDIWTRIKWHWSAAACAISFFKSLPRYTRVQIRRVLLLEDHEWVVGHPECRQIKRAISSEYTEPR